MADLLEKYVRIPGRVRFLVGVSLIAVFPLANYLLLFQQQHVQRVQLQEKLQQLTRERAEKMAYAQSTKKCDDRYDKLQASFTAARMQLPDNPDVAQFLAQIGTRGQRSGLTIDRFEPKAETKRDFFSEIVFEMKVRGSYHEIGTFIDAVGKMERIVNLRNISLVNPKVENQKVVVEGKFEVKTYRFLGDSSGAGATKPVQQNPR